MVYVVATWSRGSPPDGEAFDVQRRLENGPWQDFASATAPPRRAAALQDPGKT